MNRKNLAKAMTVIILGLMAVSQFTLIHEEIHRTIFYHIGGVNSHTEFYLLYGATYPSNVTEMKNVEEVEMLNTITELYQYQLLTLFTMFLLVSYCFSIIH